MYSACVAFYLVHWPASETWFSLFFCVSFFSCISFAPFSSLKDYTYLHCIERWEESTLQRYQYQYDIKMIKINMISDIDECKAAETHNCGFNAFCNNTDSAYNCTCKPGYLGDGWNCTGNWLLYEGIFGGLGPYLAQRKSHCKGLSKVKPWEKFEVNPLWGYNASLTKEEIYCKNSRLPLSHHWGLSSKSPS